MAIESIPALDQLVASVKADFKERFGREATIVVAAPGRVNLIGEHIDYCDGYVMPFALPLYAVVAAAPNETGEPKAVLTAGKGFEDAVIDLSVNPEVGQPTWANYPRGVLDGFRTRGLWPIKGFDAMMGSTIPLGAGLSSSAAVEVVFATLLEVLTGTELGPKEKALLSQKAEHEFANVPCGIMDQFASAFGEENRLVLIDCVKEEAQLVPFEHEELTVLISNTKVSHQLSDGGYAKRRKQTEVALAAIGKPNWREVTMDDVEAIREEVGDEVFRRARHVVGEIARTLGAAKALEEDDLEQLGTYMWQSHESLRDDFEVSCRELDVLVEAAAELGAEGGVIGARMTGGGFGGSTVTLCRADRADAVAAFLAERYEKETGIVPQIIAARPSKGAMVIEA
ncbi:galactokinase [Sulfuriroseicoccus oceanibius]|uniref:Galactokinase n=1 Tax=Sulfuriroseicoccus oceanibius TaxID=2707525 RepID=A0A6B3LDE9_9BACT|nr:galactokinase [Sulfuriroseicoccus oceanibius]QQL45148.1 galactokinase [Sulfuriroseicoccus oceanibius]